jgi:formate dehydrogenase subunit gamma
MQVANIIHLAGACLFIMAGLGHIYMGTIGMIGAYAAMKTGYVDETWAREHHLYWYEDVKAGRVAADVEPSPKEPAAKPRPA